MGKRTRRAGRKWQLRKLMRELRSRENINSQDSPASPPRIETISTRKPIKIPLERRPVFRPPIRVPGPPIFLRINEPFEACEPRETPRSPSPPPTLRYGSVSFKPSLRDPRLTLIIQIRAEIIFEVLNRGLAW